MMANVLPKALKNSTDMVADGEFVIELASGSCMFNIWRKRGGKETVKAMHNIQNKGLYVPRQK